MGLYFEDYSVGQEFESAGRTVTEADIVAFAGLSGDFNPLHVDAEFAKTTPHGERIAHGLLGLSILSGLVHDMGILTGSAVAFRGLEWKFRGAVKIGDTLRFRLRVAAKKSMRGQGLVSFDAAAWNQKGETVQEGRWTLLFLARPSKA